MSRDRLPKALLAAGGTGFIIGLCTGYVVAAVSQYSLPLLFAVLYLVLFYGLGIAVVLVSHFLKNRLSSTMRPYPLPFSVGFACAYYIGCALFFIPALLSAEDVSQESIRGMLTLLVTE